MEGKVYCFIGHRNVKKTAKLREKLTDTSRWLITEKEVEYLLQEKQETNKKDWTVYYIVCGCVAGIVLTVLLICKIKPQGS